MCSFIKQIKETNIFALVLKTQIQILTGIRKHLTVCTCHTAT